MKKRKTQMMKLVCHYCHNYIIYIAYLLFIPSLPLSIKYYFSCCHDGSTKEKKISLDPEVARKKHVKRYQEKLVVFEYLDYMQPGFHTRGVGT